jgi:predicted membrane protein
VAVDANRGRGSRFLIVLGAIAAVILLVVVVAVIVAFTWFDVSLNDGVGDRSYAPESAGDVQREYELGVGSMKLDLAQVSVDEELHVDAHVGIGELRVIVPRDASVGIDAHVKGGEIDALGDRDEGRDASVKDTEGGKLRLKMRVGAGSIDVVRGR